MGRPCPFCGVVTGSGCKPNEKKMVVPVLYWRNGKMWIEYVAGGISSILANIRNLQEILYPASEISPM